uniref:Uncharacterized protein n=1 Tax=Arundo donax TaxID=35708 RepID=A0A0A9BJ90_ARUDO
MSSYLDRGTSM